MGRKRVHVHIIWNFGTCLQIPAFHAQIWQFWKSAHVTKNAVRRVKISLISTTWGRKRVHMQLWDLSSNSRFHAQIWKFWKMACILKRDACRAKIRSISTLLGRKRVHMQHLELFFNSRFHACGNFDNHAVAWKSPQILACVVLPLFYTKNWHADFEFACKILFSSFEELLPVANMNTSLFMRVLVESFIYNI